ncbi:MAG TPA: tetratricopeptide repeat protein, partial [Anaerolineaceae bacterium]
MKKNFLPLIIILALFLQSCSTILPFLATSTPTAVPTATITPTPTSTPTPLPSPTSTPSPTPLPAARLDNADLLVQAGDYAKALQEYQTAYNTAKDDPTRAAALIGVGRIQLLQGTPLVAITTLTDAIGRFPQSDKIASANYFLGQAYAAMNNHPKALEAYAAYLQKKPGVLDAYIQELRGDTFAAMDDYKSALDAYTASVKAAQRGDPTDVKLKIGQMYAALADNNNALRTYLAVYDATQNEYYKAQANLLAGQIYMNMGMVEQAQARYLDSVNNFPSPYDSYTALVTLVNAGVTVDELQRGIIDYNAGQYGYALEALNRYLTADPKADGAATAHYYKALTLIDLNLPRDSIAEWDILIKNF